MVFEGTGTSGSGSSGVGSGSGAVVLSECVSFVGSVKFSCGSVKLKPP